MPNKIINYQHTFYIKLYSKTQGKSLSLQSAIAHATRCLEFINKYNGYKQAL